MRIWTGSLHLFDPQHTIPEQSPHFAGPSPRGRAGAIPHSSPLPIAGSTALELPVDRLWETFLDVLIWAFIPIKRGYLYKLPALAEIVEFEPYERITWEVTMPGFHAVHAYRFAALGEQRCRFGSWEVAEGPAYRAVFINHIDD